MTLEDRDQSINEPLSDYIPSSNRAYYYRARAALKAAGRKEVCEDNCDRLLLELQVHHIDGNISNNKPENLKYLCVDCHALAHPDRADLILSRGI